MKAFMSVAWFGLLLLAFPLAGRAQTSQTPPKVYAGNIGAGLSLTGGNTDTVNFNVSGELTRDPKKNNVIKLKGLYLRSDADNIKTADRLTLGFRDEYSFSKRAFAFGALNYFRDPFKEISYLLNPHGGLGYKPILTERIELALTGGAGAVWEKNPFLDVRSSGTLNAGETFTVKLSETSRFSQGFAALWKTSDFEDALYHFSVALVTSLYKNTEVKIEFIDDYKNVTPRPAIKNNDTAFIVSFLYKI